MRVTVEIDDDELERLVMPRLLKEFNKQAFQLRLNGKCELELTSGDKGCAPFRLDLWAHVVSPSLDTVGRKKLGKRALKHLAKEFRDMADIIESQATAP